MLTPLKKSLFYAAAVVLSGHAALAHAQTSAPQSYVDEISAWRERAETSLKRDLGWLTLAGRWELKQGENRIGSAKAGNDIVFPPETAPAHLGAIHVNGTTATLKLAPGLEMFTARVGGTAFSEREMPADVKQMQWVHRDRLALTTFKHPAGKMILRIADHEYDLRKNFPGRLWYDVKPALKLDAKFTPAAPGRKQAIVNVLGEVTDEVVAGTLSVVVAGRTLTLDALGEPEDKDLFVIFNDASADPSGNGTYPAGRFLVVPRPKAGQTNTVVDFNRAYNPPCAFSAFTSCPLPPSQNQLKAKIEAGEKFRGG